MDKKIVFREIKKEIRILGIDDCPFIPKKYGKAEVIGLVYRGGYCIDGVMRTKVDVDGFDATDKIIKMIRSSRHYNQLRIIMLDGITVAGFNIIDINKLFESTGLPVIALTREETNFNDVQNALKNLSSWEKRWQIIQKAGKIFKLKVGVTEIYMQIAGISYDDATKIVRISCTRANIPEPLRGAHIIASGLARPIDQ